MIGRLLIAPTLLLSLLPSVAQGRDFAATPVGHSWSWKCNVQDEMGARFLITGVIRKVPKTYLTDGYKLVQVSATDRHFRWLGWFSKDDKSMPTYLDSVKSRPSSFQMTFENTWGYQSKEIDVNRDIILAFDRQGISGRGKFKVVRNSKISSSQRENGGISASGPCLIRDAA